MAAKRKPNEISLTRIYDAPVKAVWDAYTDPVQAAKWWGPRGFTIKTKSKELKPGGQWIYTMYGPDGVVYPNIATYHEVEKYSKLVYDHGATETTPPLFRVTVTFAEKNGKTTMDMTMSLPTAEAATQTKKFIKQANGNSTWDRLGEYLEKQKNGQEKFFINRVFEAPIDVIFDMWTKPEHVSKWLPPTGMDMKYLRSDIKVGAKSFYSMSGHGMTMFGTSEYVEIERPTKIVFKQQFTDEKENISRHPGAPTWPETLLTKVTLTSESETETRVTIESQVFGEATPAELEAFVKERSGMTQGWTGSFDKLEELLTKL